MSPLEAGSGMIGGVARRVSSPVLVGRDAEAAQLKAALERAAAGRPANVVLSLINNSEPTSHRAIWVCVLCC
jgi:hypothetical protein